MTRKALPPLVGLAEIAEMAGGVSKQRAGQIMDRRLHPEAPEGQHLKCGPVWLKADVAAYLLSLGRPKTW